ncbi:MAG TPA: methyltransferase domain-containing protein [Gemmatimonadaceae bacterium]|nr:methyltransferase domain-containing protein [Gemmatimonadaceae bacterium]
MTSDTERWKGLDAASYDEIADQYDTISHRLAYPVAARLVELAALAPGERVLDVGTGTGMVPFEVARTAAGTSVVGTDISSGMIEKASRKAVEHGLDPDRVSFQVMDAEAMSFAPGEFDVVTSAFALGHMPRPERAMAEMFRVMRPGGRLLVTVGSRPPLASLPALRHAAVEVGRRLRAMRGLRLGADLLDRLVDATLPPDTDAPQGAELATQLSRADSIMALARGAGFDGVEWTWQNFQNEIASADEFWEVQRTICTRARKRLLSAAPDAIEEVRRRFIETSLRTLRRGGQLVFPVSAVFVTARKHR